MLMPFEAGIVRLCTADGSIVGTGFLVTDRYVLTCAHVVESAGAGPGDTVDVIFHATGEAGQATVEPDWWRDPAAAEDVAILRQQGSFPEGIEPFLLGSSGSTSGHLFKTFGFPDIR
jgi:hypothetical protein